MKLENQVVPLELSKQLKEAGYKQEGLWIWEPALPIYPKYEPITKSYLYSKDSSWFSCSSVVAPTVAELGEALPCNITSNNYNCVLFINKIGIGDSGKWKCYYSSYNGKYGESGELSDTLANAMAKMWLYLKKEGLIK